MYESEPLCSSFAVSMITRITSIQPHHPFSMSGLIRRDSFFASPVVPASSGSSGGSGGGSNGSYGWGSGGGGGEGSSHSAFFPLLSDPAALHHEKERAYYLREEDKILQTVAQMARCQSLTDGMLAILDRFDSTLSALESQMLPIHKGTQQLTTAQKNIDLTLTETEQIILHYSTATESEASVQAHTLNAVDYADYLRWAERIHRSINFFTLNKERLQHAEESSAGPGGAAGGAGGTGGGAGGANGAGPRGASTANGPRASASGSGLSSSSAGGGVGGAASAAQASDCEKYLRKLKDLNKRVMSECEGEFERVLSASSRQALDLSRTGWPLPSSVSPVDGSVVPFQLVPILSVAELSAIAERMACAGVHTYMGIILAQRQGFLRLTLKKVFHDEHLKFLNHALQQGGGGGVMGGGGGVLMQMRGSILQAASDAYAPSSSAANTPAGGGGGSAHLYQKRSHKSVFYLEFFLRLLELENHLLTQLLCHVFSDEERQANGIVTSRPPASKDSMLVSASSLASSGVGAPLGSKMLGSSAVVGALGSLTNMAGTQASTGNLTVFWGQQAYDQLWANIVEAPLEYFRRKIDQNTYLGASGVAAGFGKLSSVFHIPGLGGSKSSSAGASSSSSSAAAAAAAADANEHGGSGSGGDIMGSSLLTGGGIAGSSSSVNLASGGTNPSLPLGTQLSNKILIVLDVLDQLNALLPRYRMLLKKHAHFEKLTELQQALTTLARKTLAEYREYMIEYTERASRMGGGGGGGGGSSSSGLGGGSSLALLGVGGKSSASSVQRDGTIYTLTVETLQFLKRLCDYRAVIDQTPTLLDKHHHQHAAAAAAAAQQAALDGSSHSTHSSSSGLLDSHSFPTSPTDSTMHSLCTFLLSGLEQNMEHRARSMKPPALSAIFLLNNYHYCVKFLKKNAQQFNSPSGAGAGSSVSSSMGAGTSIAGSKGVASGVPGNGPSDGSFSVHPFIDRYERLVHQSMKQYRTYSWERVVSGALEVSDMSELYRHYANTSAASSAHKSARKAIKAKFALFNSAFEEMYNTQRHFSIPDAELRSQLRNDNVELVLQSYKQLYNTFASVDFSTNPAKYTKYTPAVLEQMLGKFFDETE